ncbi:DUF3631 domain-containing protein [Nocardioides sp. LHG3406-4]|uniref:DUF3631 domain-containing protein n=1 Tax=Nocardioides sp. LHG3406-4 TaxID=2804575 RepID=UPI003CE971CC
MAKKKTRRTDHDLIPDLMRFIGSYVVMTEAQKVVLATYVMHTHIAQYCQQTPYIFIHSPEPECGKSRLMEVLELLVVRPWMIVNPSDAVLFRKVHADMPTLLWDEIDAVFAPKSAQFHEEQRGMLDQGHRRHGRVPRFIGDKVTEFRVYCPKVFAGIGTLPDTLSRRSIPISLKRRAPDEPVDEFILIDVEPDAEALQARIGAWVDEHGETAATTRPTGIPESISDHMKEGCFSLFSIADLLGAGEDLRKALEEILTGDRLDAQQTMRMRLLTDLRLIFAVEYRRTGKARRFMSTDALIDRLHGFEESPWSTYYGRGLEAKDIADLLRQYGLHPRLVNVKGERRRGYRRNQHGEDVGLAEVWLRYLGADETAVDPDAR